ncbi:MAG: hypothetical protein UT26_C0032G0003 [Microgenomates group bacterium GW2011_GWC1_39_12]|nr:MAG: hypothetical protein UT26_C0032G0003 [Microgenomates group bacterium GW2011_GWC1_39_12]
MKKSIERLSRRAKSFVKANKERLNFRFGQIAADLVAGYFAISSSLILSDAVPRIVYENAGLCDYANSAVGLMCAALPIPFFYISKKFSDIAYSPKKITLPRLGISFYADRRDEFHDDGIVESIPNRLKEVDEKYGIAQDDDVYSGHSNSLGVECPRTNTEGGKVSRIFYLDHPGLQNTILHEEIHALDRFRRMDRLEDKLEKENGVVLRGLQNIENLEIKAELSTQLGGENCVEVDRYRWNQANTIAGEIVQRGDGRGMDELYVETKEGFVPVTSKKLGMNYKIPILSQDIPRVYTREEVEAIRGFS